MLSLVAREVISEDADTTVSLLVKKLNQSLDCFLEGLGWWMPGLDHS